MHQFGTHLGTTENLQLLAHAQGVVARPPAPRGSPPPARMEVWRAWNFRPYQRWSDPAVRLPARRCVQSGWRIVLGSQCPLRHDAVAVVQRPMWKWRRLIRRDDAGKFTQVAGHLSHRASQGVIRKPTCTRIPSLLLSLHAEMCAYRFLLWRRVHSNSHRSAAAHSVPISLCDQEQEHEIRQRVDFLSIDGHVDGSTKRVSASMESNLPRERRRVLLMMEAAERELGNWSAFLPGQSTRMTATMAQRAAPPACADVSLHSVLGEVRACVRVAWHHLRSSQFARGCPTHTGCG